MTHEEEVRMQLEQDRAWHQKMQEESYARQQAEQPQSEKMGWGIFLPALFLCVVADLIDAFTAGTIGWLIGIFVDLLLLLMLGLSGSARKQWKKWLTGLAGESIPIIDALPLRSGFLLWSFISSRSEKLQEVSRIISQTLPRSNKINAVSTLASRATSNK